MGAAEPLTGWPAMGLLLPFVVNLLSLVAALVLLIWIWRLKASLARRLMARQLWYLALADVLASIMYAVEGSVEIVIQFDVISEQDINQYSGLLDGFCGIGSGYMAGVLASALVEVNMALAFVSIIFRCTRALHVLYTWLRLMWLTGLSLGLFVAVFYRRLSVDTAWGCSMGDGPRRERGNKAQNVELAVLAITVVICVAAYLIGTVDSWRSTGISVQRRSLRQIQYFLLATITTWGPFLMLASFPGKNTSAACGAIALGLRQANGLLNAGVYALFSRFLRRTRRRERANYIAEGVQETSRGSELPPAESWNVRFAMDHEEFSVPPLTAIANRRAQAQMQGSSTFSSIGESFTEDDLFACFDPVLEGQVAPAERGVSY